MPESCQLTMRYLPKQLLTYGVSISIISYKRLFLFNTIVRPCLQSVVRSAGPKVGNPLQTIYKRTMETKKKKENFNIQLYNSRVMKLKAILVIAPFSIQLHIIGLTSIVVTQPCVLYPTAQRLHLHTTDHCQLHLQCQRRSPSEAYLAKAVSVAKS